MATQKQIELICDITRAAAQVSIQGTYHAFATYSGHIDGLCVYAYQADGEYDDSKNMMPGWSTADRWISLQGQEDESDKAACDLRLETILADVRGLLDVDADGVPV
jgi:hypothetical protein